MVLVRGQVPPRTSPSLSPALALPDPGAIPSRSSASARHRCTHAGGFLTVSWRGSAEMQLRDGQGGRWEMLVPRYAPQGWDKAEGLARAASKAPAGFSSRGCSRASPGRVTLLCPAWGTVASILTWVLVGALLTSSYAPQEAPDPKGLEKHLQV